MLVAKSGGFAGGFASGLAKGMAAKRAYSSVLSACLARLTADKLIIVVLQRRTKLILWVVLAFAWHKALHPTNAAKLLVESVAHLLLLLAHMLLKFK